MDPIAHRAPLFTIALPEDLGQRRSASAPDDLTWLWRPSPPGPGDDDTDAVEREPDA